MIKLPPKHLMMLSKYLSTMDTVRPSDAFATTSAHTPMWNPLKKPIGAAPSAGATKRAVI